MYLLSNRNTENLQELDNPMISRSGDSLNSILPYYHLKSPFQLNLITFHPDDADNYFSLSFFVPDFVLHSSLAKQEMEHYPISQMHQHDFYELLFLLEGSFFQRIENQRHLYTPGGCCLLNRNIRHTEEYSADFRAIFLEISEEFLQEIFQNSYSNYFEVEKNRKMTQLEEFLFQNIYHKNQEKNYIDLTPIHDNAWVIQNVHNIFEQITMEMLSPHFGSSLLIRGLFFKLLHLLADPSNYETKSLTIGTPAENAVFDRIAKLMSDTNGRITRNELTKALNYSGTYINNITKKYTGLSIFEYSTTFCMKEAARLLLDTSMTVSEIAITLGFSNRNHFYKMFAETYHMTPAEYRKRNMNHLRM